MTDRWTIVVGVWCNESRNPCYDEGMNIVSQAEVRWMVSAYGCKCQQDEAVNVGLAHKTTSAFREGVRPT